jgi:MraZ protein
MLGPLWGRVEQSGEMKLLTGTYVRSLDDKQRIAVPKRVRDAMGGEEITKLYLAPGTDGSLAIYTEEAFFHMANHFENGPPTGHDVRAFSRVFYAQTESVEVDRQGRIRIPPELVQLADLTKEVVLLGVRDHLELWDRQRWEAYLSTMQTQYDSLAESAFGGVSSAGATAPNTESAEVPKQPR